MSRKDQVKFELKDRASETHNPGSVEEIMAMAMQLSSESITLSKRVFYATIAFGAVTLCGVGAAGWNAWENHQMNEMMMTKQMEVKAPPPVCETKPFDTPPVTPQPAIMDHHAHRPIPVATTPAEEPAEASEAEERLPSSEAKARGIVEQKPDQAEEAPDTQSDAEKADATDSPAKGSESDPAPE